jgi:hypothetical protein
MALGGSFVVAWESGPGEGIFARRFSSAGAALGSELAVNTAGGLPQLPDVAVAGDGSFAVVWETADAAGRGVAARRFDSAGAPLGAEFIVNTVTTDFDQRAPRIAAGASGPYAVAWDSIDFGNPPDIVLRRVGLSGAALAAEAYVSPSGVRPSLAVGPTGTAYVDWRATELFGQAQLRRYDAGSVPIGSPVALGVSQANTRPLAALADGSFVIVQPGVAILARLYDPNGQAVGAEFRVDTARTFCSGVFCMLSDPAVAGRPAKRWAIAWDSADADGLGIYARVFRDPRN